ncbi:MAG: L-threonylcarbamoyladenylate synthase [Rhizobiaceae bacterium]
MAETVSVADGLAPALALLRAGEAVVVPTETVYGLAGDATSGEAVARIFEIKGRPRFNPLIVHVADTAMAERIGRFDPVSRALAERFWPGPLTLVVPLVPQASVHALATVGLDTVALRMPRGFGRDLIRAFGKPLAAPSANSSGGITGTTAEAVDADLGSKVRLIVDGGPAPVGVESTIVKAGGGSIVLLRPGGVTADEIEAVAKLPVERGMGGAVVAPGMLASHYAPGAAVRLNATAVEPGEALIAFGPDRIAGAAKAIAVANLSEAGDLREAAANLFSSLHRLDRSGASVIAVEPIPAHGIGEAIMDRLARAAAPRLVEAPT